LIVTLSSPMVTTPFPLSNFFKDFLGRLSVLSFFLLLPEFTRTFCVLTGHFFLLFLFFHFYLNFATWRTNSFLNPLLLSVCLPPISLFSLFFYMSIVTVSQPLFARFCPRELDLIAPHLLGTKCAHLHDEADPTCFAKNAIFRPPCQPLRKNDFLLSTRPQLCSHCSPFFFFFF